MKKNCISLVCKGTNIFANECTATSAFAEIPVFANSKLDKPQFVENFEVKSRRLPTATWHTNIIVSQLATSTFNTLG